MKTLPELKKDSIAHYDRMIRWAKTQDPKEETSSTQMQRATNEWWGTQDCPFCSTFRMGTCCGDCPLRDGPCCKGLWQGMNHADTWGRWVIAAEKVREYIENVEEETNNV